MIFKSSAKRNDILKQKILGYLQNVKFEESLLAPVASGVNPSFTLEELGIKPRIDIGENNQMTIELQAGFPVDSIEKKYTHTLFPLILKAIQDIAPNHTIQLDLSSFIKPHRTQLFSKGLRGVKNTLAIASGKGGVGKSTVTVNLAIALARAGARVGVLDADIYGPSIPLMLGNTQPIKQESEKIFPVFTHGIYAMSIAYLMESDQALIWRGPMLAKSLIQLLNLTQWEELDYLLIDLPPGTGDIQLSLVQKIPLAGALIVTTPQAIATTDAQKAIKMFEKTNIDILGIIENMAFYHCKQCGHEDLIFGSEGGQRLSHSSNVPLLGQLPLNQQIQNDCDQGQPTASHVGNELGELWMAIALRTSIELAKKPLNYAGKFPNIIVE